MMTMTAVFGYLVVVVLVSLPIYGVLKYFERKREERLMAEQVRRFGEIAYGPRRRNG